MRAVHHLGGLGLKSLWGGGGGGGGGDIFKEGQMQNNYATRTRFMPIELYASICSTVDAYHVLYTHILWIVVVAVITCTCER